MTMLKALFAAVTVLSLNACTGEMGAPTEPTTSVAGAGLTVVKNDAASFEGTYRASDAWARVRVEYTATTTLFEVTTSYGTTLIQDGTAFGKDAKPTVDPRANSNGALVLTASDVEHPLVTGLLESLMALGATSRPTSAEKGTTLYAAAQTAARVLGRIEGELTEEEREVSLRIGAGVKPTATEVRIIAGRPWPSPGFDDEALMPDELRAGAQNVDGTRSCCGPYNCRTARFSWSMACDDWCAAGDSCNYLYGNWNNQCGTAFYWPRGGWNSCPHSNGSLLHAYGGAANYNYNHWGYPGTWDSY